MLIRDRFGYLRDLPEQGLSGRSNPRFGEVVYDRLGNPLGLPFIAALAPLAAKLLPMAANLLPMLTSSSPSSPPPTPSVPAPAASPSSPPFPAAASSPQVIVIREAAPQGPPFASQAMPSVPARPMLVLRRRGARRRRAPIRVKVRRETEQVSIPQSPAPPAASPPLATESSGGMNGWYPAPGFSGYF